MLTATIIYTDAQLPIKDAEYMSAKVTDNGIMTPVTPKEIEDRSTYGYVLLVEQSLGNKIGNILQGRVMLKPHTIGGHHCFEIATGRLHSTYRGQGRMPLMIHRLVHEKKDSPLFAMTWNISLANKIAASTGLDVVGTITLQADNSPMFVSSDTQPITPESLRIFYNHLHGVHTNISYVLANHPMSSLSL